MSVTLPRASRAFLSIAATATLCVLAFWPTFRWMAERFDAHDSFYSHGWLVPLASGWLVWQRRKVLRRTLRHASWWGLLLLMPAVLVQVAATWWHLGFVSGFAFVGTIWGLVWTYWGWSVLWALRFPLLFLLFMVPLPGVLLIAISFHLKMMAAALATGVLNLMGLHALHAGSTIQLRGASVIVDDTCSGLRSLISLITLATLWISFMPPSSTRWPKFAIIGASIPIALVANMVRIIALVLLAAVYGPEAADGFLHYGSGIVVFGVALVVLAWLTRVLHQCSEPSFGLNR